MPMSSMNALKKSVRPTPIAPSRIVASKVEVLRLYVAKTLTAVNESPPSMSNVTVASERMAPPALSICLTASAHELAVFRASVLRFSSTVLVSA